MKELVAVGGQKHAQTIRRQVAAQGVGTKGSEQRCEREECPAACEDPRSIESHVRFFIKGVMRSSGRGNTIVELFSFDMSARVCRYRSCMAAGSCESECAAWTSICAAWLSPSA